ncbi:MAG: ATP-binding protein [Deltaproteobacteria bacterium]|nr:ATP-binding protein [Deltaproteobacteria bacterium]MBW1816170.1 ATP-binding protein [Deltaproteobacteria bacterium]
MYKRSLRLPDKPVNSFFLWGPRKTGKTTLLKSCYPDALRIDLLKTDELMRYTKEPSLLREDVAALPPERLVVIDEIQKAPVLLDEIHYMIQEWQRVFGLCGSSARKVRKGRANLLGGRAIRYELLGLVSQELGDDFSIERFVNAGPLPDHYMAENPERVLQAYVDDYLREEILQEGLTRRLPVFSDFLRVAAIGDTEILNMSNIARETGISVSTVRDHYGILIDTLMGAFLPAFTLRPKRRTIQAPKFYFRDLGVVNHLARRGAVKPGSELFGKAFENWLFHELSVHSRYSGLFYELSYWRLSSGIEVDFILGQGSAAIEAKGKHKVTSSDTRGLLSFKKDFPEVKWLIVVCLEKRIRKTEDGIYIVPYQKFVQLLWEKKWTV